MQETPLFEVPKPTRVDGPITKAMNAYIGKLLAAAPDDARRQAISSVVDTLARRLDEGGKAYSIAQLSAQLFEWFNELAPDEEESALPDISAALHALDEGAA